MNGYSGETFSEGGFRLPKKLFFNGEELNENSISNNKKISHFESRNNHSVAATNIENTDDKEKQQLDLINQ